MSSSAVPLELSRDTKAWRIFRGAQSVPRPAAFVIFLNSEHVVTIKWCANSRSEDKTVIFPENTSQQPVPRLAV